jgi:hypothetical protein
VKWSRHLYDPTWCRYCITDHPTRAHHDPRDARRQLARAISEGNRERMEFWRRITASLENKIENEGFMSAAKVRPIQWMHPVHEKIRAAAKSSDEAETYFQYRIDITYDIAATFLESRHERQRRMEEKTYTGYARAMRGEGDGWDEAACGPVLFDANGWLVDGQNRLAAVLELAGAFVWRDATVRVLKRSAETRTIPVDNHRPRTQSDHERWMGLVCPKQISAGIVYEHCDFSLYRVQVLSKAERAAIVFNSPVLSDIRRIHRIDRVPAGVAAAAARCIKANPDAGRFFDHVLRNTHTIDGEYNANIKHLATWLHRATSEKKYAGDHFKRECVFRSISAWNGYRRGLQPQILPRYSAEMPLPEALP